MNIVDILKTTPDSSSGIRVRRRAWPNRSYLNFSVNKFVPPTINTGGRIDLFYLTKVDLIAEDWEVAPDD